MLNTSFSNISAILWHEQNKTLFSVSGIQTVNK